MLQFSQAALSMRSSEIRRLMALAADPAIISFAGGMPNNDLFPLKALDTIYQNLTVAEKQIGLQYGPTPGLPPLLKSLELYLKTKKLPVDTTRTIITTGAQQALNLVAKTMINSGDVVITEIPSFIGALAAFKSYGAELVGVPMDEQGIIINNLVAALDAHGEKAKILYINTHFHNPAGITYSLERKQALVKALQGRNIVLLEDDPYGELYFNDSDAALTQPIASMNIGDIQLCYAGTFAKIFGPGLRLGWLMGSPEIVEKCELAKQSMDACSSSLTQILAHAFLRDGHLAPYLAWLRPIYKRRAALMLDALKKYAPENVTWTTPHGGFFVWVTMPKNLDATAVFNRALKEGAAFVIGQAFDPQGIDNNSFRLAFSHTPEESIERGIEIVCRAMQEELKQLKA